MRRAFRERPRVVSATVLGLIVLALAAGLIGSSLGGKTDTSGTQREAAARHRAEQRLRSQDDKLSAAEQHAGKAFDGQRALRKRLDASARRTRAERRRNAELRRQLRKRRRKR